MKSVPTFAEQVAPHEGNSYPNIRATHLSTFEARACYPHGPVRAAKMVKHRSCDLPLIGWREWVGLPDLGIPSIKAKVDTGARSSSLHAFALQKFEREGTTWVRFQVYPVQRQSAEAVDVETPVLEFRSVRSSSGKATLRPVIITRVALLGATWPIELTLASRDEMGFRMLLGREAFRERFLIDAGKSYYGGKPKRKKKQR